MKTFGKFKNCNKILPNILLVSPRELFIELFEGLIVRDKVSTEFGRIITIRVTRAPVLHHNLQIKLFLFFSFTLCFLLCMVPLGSLTSRSTFTFRLGSSTRALVKFNLNLTVFIDWNGKRGQNLNEWRRLLQQQNMAILPVQKPRFPAVGFSKVCPSLSTVSPQSLIVVEKPLMSFPIFQVGIYEIFQVGIYEIEEKCVIMILWGMSSKLIVWFVHNTIIIVPHLGSYSYNASGPWESWQHPQPWLHS